MGNALARFAEKVSAGTPNSVVIERLATTFSIVFDFFCKALLCVYVNMSIPADRDAMADEIQNERSDTDD